MLLALGSVTIPTQGRTVVIGVADANDAAALERAAAGADALWLRAPATPDEVGAVGRATGLPVGVTVAGIAELDGLISAGAVGIECAAEGAFELVADADVAVWCAPAHVRAAVRAGVPEAHLIAEGAGTGVRGATVEGAGPAAWGAVVRAVRDGAQVVRTIDPRAVRRVLAVTDRLLAVRSSVDEGARA